MRAGWPVLVPCAGEILVTSSQVLDGAGESLRTDPRCNAYDRAGSGRVKDGGGAVGGGRWESERRARLGEAELGAGLGRRATLVQFSSAFCQPCRATRRTLAEVAAMVEGVAHVEIDAEERLELVRELEIAQDPDGARARRGRAASCAGRRPAAQARTSSRRSGRRCDAGAQ